ncbi:hypothetical protein [Stutzerimonas xanthomarina]
MDVAVIGCVVNGQRGEGGPCRVDRWQP